MSACLLDVNALIALAWPSHVLHQRVTRWFGKHAARGWATCPFTQAAFVRILSNPAFSSHSLSPGNAVALLERNVAHPAHQFWPADMTLNKALTITQVRPTGHQQITDLYLLGLAMSKRGVLVTCDEAIRTWAAVAGAEKHLVEVIPTP